MIKITFWHMTRAAHCIGANAYSQRARDLVPYRNYYIGSFSDSRWTELCQTGLATAMREGLSTAVFRLTPKGVEFTQAFLDLARRDRGAFSAVLPEVP